MANSHLLQFTDDNFQAEVLDSSQPVLVDLWAEWCPPCRMLMPTIEKLADQYAGNVRVGKLNVDESPKTTATYRVSSIPTVLLIKNGHVIQKFVGVQSQERYEQAINQLLVGA